MDEGNGFKVKRLTVNPGHSTSLQFHEHRSERWVVVQGEATVILGKKTYTVPKNEWIYIPQREKHLLENRGKVSVQLIEVQIGSYLGEDDIVRFEDVYGRLDTQTQSQ